MRIMNFEEMKPGSSLFVLTDIREPLPQYNRYIFNKARGDMRQAIKSGKSAYIVVECSHRSIIFRSKVT